MKMSLNIKMPLNIEMSLNTKTWILHHMSNHTALVWNRSYYSSNGSTYILMSWGSSKRIFLVNLKSCCHLLIARKWLSNGRSSRPEVFCKKVFLKISQNSLKNTCARVSFLIKLLAISCKCCQISKNTFFTEHLWTTASM